MDEVFRHFDPLGGPVETVVDGTLTDLAVSIMRVARGTGEPALVVRQVLSCASALKRYIDERQQAPSAQQVREILDFNRDRPIYDSDLTPDERSRAAAMNAIIRGALGTAAARYRKDHHQAGRGEGEIINGVRRLTGQRQ